MKTERLNSVIFIISAIVFLLQVVGYFAPAWFVQEVNVQTDLKNIHADGRRFEIPYYQTTEKPDEDIQEKNENQLLEENAKSDLSRRKRQAPIPDLVKFDDDKNMINRCDSSLNCQGKDAETSAVSKTKNPVQQDETKFLPNRGESTNNQAIPSLHEEVVEPNEDEQNKLVNPKFSQTDLDKSDGGNLIEPDQGNMKQTTDPDGKKQILYLSAGLWYSRACISARDPTSDDGTAGMLWCTLYTRTDDNTLEKKKKNMFEIRLEASFGIALSFLSLIVSSTACCFHRHHGRRAVTSLTTLFISGAVSAIPVVHIIIEHVQIHENIVRTRKWMHLTKMMHVKHDLFDHYSVILCGVASLISVVSVFIITIMSCRSNQSKPDNWYDLKHVPEEKESKHELPINWVHNNKITVPEATEIQDETREDSESGYSDVKDESTVSVHDGGSVGHGCDRLEFDSNEMKTFDM